MLIKTILNRIHKLTSHVYQDTRLNAEPNAEGDLELSLEVDIVPRTNGRIVCSGCQRPARCYDTARTARHFQFVPLWNIPVFLRYHMRRVDCPRCGVKGEAVP